MVARRRRVIPPIRAAAGAGRPSTSSGSGAVRPHGTGATPAGPAAFPSFAAGPAHRPGDPSARTEGARMH